MLYRNGHTIFTAKDFTEDEVNRKNILAVAVIEDGVEICKFCGAVDEQLKIEHSNFIYTRNVLPGKIRTINIEGKFSL